MVAPSSETMNDMSYDPRHYKFERTCPGFYPERRQVPRALIEVAKGVAVAGILIIAAAAVGLLIAHM